jgi:threonyl-tRNA synthetase
LWLSPVQIRLLAVADRHVPYAEELKAQFKKAGFQCDIDASHESVSKKVRAAQLAQVNYILTLGDKEVENKTINVRTRNNVVHGEMCVEPFIEAITIEKNERHLDSAFKSPKSGEV